MMKQIITLSDNAAQRIKEIMSKAESNAVGVREVLSLVVVQACLI